MIISRIPHQRRGSFVANHKAKRFKHSLVGDHLALDFVNTSPSDVRPDLIGNGADFVEWLKEVRAIDPEFASRTPDVSALQDLELAVRSARDFRRWLQGFVSRYAGRPLQPDTIQDLEPLNRLLAEDRSFFQVEANSDNLGSRNHDNPFSVVRRRVRSLFTVDQLLQPIGEAVADLVCNVNFRFVRTCEGENCTLVFLDRTKPHARRWCSMTDCGNRAKAAAFRSRAARRKFGGANTPT